MANVELLHVLVLISRLGLAPTQLFSVNLLITELEYTGYFSSENAYGFTPKSCFNIIFRDI